MHLLNGERYVVCHVSGEKWVLEDLVGRVSLLRIEDGRFQEQILGERWKVFWKLPGRIQK